MWIIAFNLEVEKKTNQIAYTCHKLLEFILKITLMREQSSARITKSRIIGAASSESSHVLCNTNVLCPPIMISLVYSSMARLLSPT